MNLSVSLPFNFQCFLSLSLNLNLLCSRLFSRTGEKEMGSEVNPRCELIVSAKDVPEFQKRSSSEG